MYIYHYGFKQNQYERDVTNRDMHETEGKLRASYGNRNVIVTFGEKESLNYIRQVFAESECQEAYRIRGNSRTAFIFL